VRLDHDVYSVENANDIVCVERFRSSVVPD